MYINKDQIARIAVHHKRKNGWYQYKPEFKILFFTITKAGFYSISGRYAGETLKDSIVNDHGEVIYKPHCQIVTSDGFISEVFLQSSKAVDDFVSDIIKNRPFIKVK